MARHAPESVNRQTLQRINAQHIDTDKLEAAVAGVVNEYLCFELPRFWGAPNVAIADGTQIELRENNLLGERHIRFGQLMLDMDDLLPPLTPGPLGISEEGAGGDH